MNINGRKPIHGGCGTLTYARWKSMMQRCNNKSASNYQYYGAIGIFVCERWKDYAAFLIDMGECKDKSMTLDRIDNSRGYEPSNCQWVTQAAQNRNRSWCINLTHNGETKILTDWAAEKGMTVNTLATRIRLGWSTERALTQPLKKRTVK
jgi:hypothetical protein